MPGLSGVLGSLSCCVAGLRHLLHYPANSVLLLPGWRALAEPGWSRPRYWLLICHTRLCHHSVLPAGSRGDRSCLQCCPLDLSGEAWDHGAVRARCVCRITNILSNRLLCHHLFALSATSIVLHLCGQCGLLRLPSLVTISHTHYPQTWPLGRLALIGTARHH